MKTRVVGQYNDIELDSTVHNMTSRLENLIPTVTQTDPSCV